MLLILVAGPPCAPPTRLVDAGEAAAARGDAMELLGEAAGEAGEAVVAGDGAVAMRSPRQPHYHVGRTSLQIGSAWLPRSAERQEETQPLLLLQ